MTQIMPNRFSFDDMLARENAKSPRRHPHDAEHRLQAACVQWFRLQHRDLAYALFAVPNGGRRDESTGRRLKEEGVVPGVADLILLHSNAAYGALLIEMKTSTGRQSDEQRRWQQLIERDGYHYVICRSLEDFIREITTYLSNC